MLGNLPAAPFDPALIRNYHFVHGADGEKPGTGIQFIAIGDRHRLVKVPNAGMQVVVEPGQGKPFRYGPVFTIDEALEILGRETHLTHADIARHIRQQTET